MLAMGLFGIAEILRNLEPGIAQRGDAQIGRLLPTRAELKRCFGPIVRATGRLDSRHPARQRRGARAASYALEKKLAKDPRASARSDRRWPGRKREQRRRADFFIPLLTLGIPPNVMALMVGAMTIHGLIPGRR